MISMEFSNAAPEESHRVHRGALGSYSEYFEKGCPRVEICICGHTDFSHNLSRECNVGASVCRCPNFHPVSNVVHGEFFFQKGSGSGWHHSLSLGILLATRQNDTPTIPKFAEPWKKRCFYCKELRSAMNPCLLSNSSPKSLVVDVNSSSTTKWVCEVCIPMSKGPFNISPFEFLQGKELTFNGSRVVPPALLL